jgi:AraC-like DNA-binding protein
MSNDLISELTDELFCTNKFVRDFCLLGESVGLAREEFARRLGMSLKSIEDPQIVISRHYILKGYKILLEFTDDELLGAAKLKMPRGSVELMVKSASIEQTLLQGIEAINQVLKISQSSANSNFIIEGSLVRWQFIPDVKEERFFSFLSTLIACMAYKLLSMLVKKDVSLKYAAFKEKNTINISDYQFLFLCPIKVNQPHCEIAFDKKWLDVSIRCQFQDVKHYLEVPLSLTNYSFSTLGVIRQITDILSTCPYAQFPSQQELSEQLGMSVRTMQRKLDAENTGYMQLKDDVRQRKAIFYLEHTDKHFDEISERCGFSEMASFTRAFTRWTGCTPSKYKA